MAIFVPLSGERKQGAAQLNQGEDVSGIWAIGGGRKGTSAAPLPRKGNEIKHTFV